MDAKRNRNDSIQKKKLHQSPTILADVKSTINRLENEIKEQCEDAKSAINSKQPFKEITQGKQQIIQTLDKASQLLSKYTSDEFSSTNRKSENTILKQKQECLMAEREKQWAATEENMLEDFKTKRQQKLIEIEKEWADKWKHDMEEKWSAIKSYLTEEQSETESDIRKKQFTDKFTSESLLKWEGMKNMWEMRNNIEWTANRLIRKLQWDKESDQLWKVEKQNYTAKHTDELLSKANSGINTDSKQIIDMLETCKLQTENIFQSSKAMVKITDKTQQTIEMHTSKEVEGCQELHNMMVVVSKTMQRQDEDLKTMKNKKKKLQSQCQQLTEKESEMNRRIHQYEAELKELKDNREDLVTSKRELNRTVKALYKELDAAKLQVDFTTERRPGKSREHTPEVSKQSEAEESDDDNAPTTSSDESKRGRSKDRKKNNPSARSIDGRDSKYHRKAPKSKKSDVAGGHSKTDRNSDNENADNTWKCKHCTLDNPETEYVCHVCGKSNPEQKEKMNSANVDVEKRQGRPGKSSEHTPEVSEQSDADESDDDNTPTTSSDESKHGARSKVSKRHNPTARSIDRTDSKHHRETPKSKKSDVAGGHSKTDSNSDNENADNSWKCKHCTVDNPHNKYICDVCGKTNDELRRTILEKAEMNQQRPRPGKLTKNIQIDESSSEDDDPFH